MAEDDDTPTLEIDWLKTAAGALAAVTTAVLLSTLGAVGTLIGAALGSVAATVGSALYAQGLQRSKLAVLRAQETTMLKIGVAQTEVRRAARRHDEGDDTAAEAHLEYADETLAEAKTELEPEPRNRLGLLPWKRIAIFAAGTFVVVMLAITGFEKLAGESVSNLTGGSDDQGTTFGGVTGDSGSSDDGDGGRNGGGEEDPTVEPSGTESPSEDPTDEPSSTSTQTPTEEPSSTPSEAPSSTPTPTPTTTPSSADPSPSASSSPSATP